MFNHTIWGLGLSSAHGSVHRTMLKEGLVPWLHYMTFQPLPNLTSASPPSRVQPMPPLLTQSHVAHAHLDHLRSALLAGSGLRGGTSHIAVLATTRVPEERRGIPCKLKEVCSGSSRHACVQMAICQCLRLAQPHAHN